MSEPLAVSILKQGISEMIARGVTYDSQIEGERSIGKTVDAYKVIKGSNTIDSEEDGWLFMVILKLVRANSGGEYRPDNYVDAAAYCGLMGESAAKERANDL